MNKENLLYDYCRWNWVTEAQRVLYDNSEELVDVTYDDGIFFKLALSMESTELLKVLLDYCHDYFHLEDNPATYNLEHKKIKHSLLEIFENSVVSDTMQKVIESYGFNISGNDVCSIRSEEDFSIQDEIKKIGDNFSQKHLLTKDSPDKEEGYFIVDKKFEETSDWEFDKLKRGLAANKC